MIKSIENATHYTWGESNLCDGWHLCNTKTLSVIQERMPAGTKEKLHYHTRSQQVFYILEGHAELMIDGMPYPLIGGESVQILPGLHHLIANQGDRDLKFLVISEPPSHEDRINLE